MDKDAAPGAIELVNVCSLRQENLPAVKRLVEQYGTEILRYRPPCHHMPTALSRACKNHHENIVRYLLECGVDPNVGLPLLYLRRAVLSSKALAIGKMLLDHGASPNQNNGTVSALTVAVEHGGLDLLDVLLTHPRLKLNMRLENSETALHQAVGRSYLKLYAQKLIVAGADVHVLDNSKRTPLHLAARNGSPSIVTLLVSYGADPRAKAADGQTPLDLARERRRLWHFRQHEGDEIIAALELATALSAASEKKDERKVTKKTKRKK